MDVKKNFKTIASLIGEPARAVMLWQLLDGKAFTATELAICADVSAQSASMHLNKLVKAELLAVATQGRHRYYRFSSPDVAYVIEAISTLMPDVRMIKKESTQPVSDIKYCRTCYDHLAGKVAVTITDQLVKQKVIITRSNQYDVTPKGVSWFSSVGISVNELRTERRIFARQCLDWTERRPHIAGALGAALLSTMLDKGWMHRTKNSRCVMVSPQGQKKIHDLLGCII